MTAPRPDASELERRARELARNLAALAVRAARRLVFAVSRLLRALGLALVLMLVAAAALIYAGWYNVAVSERETLVGAWIFDLALRRSVRTRAEDIAVPDLTQPDRIRRGAALYRNECEVCHRAPGVERSPVARALTPAPADLSAAPIGRKWTPAELFWIVKHGIRMSGMPAWGGMHSDEELWDIVSLVALLPTMTVEEYRQLQRE